METTDIRNLVNDALQSLRRPYSEHVIDEVFFTIESTSRWLKEYEGLCAKHTQRRLSIVLAVIGLVEL